MRKFPDGDAGYGVIEQAIHSVPVRKSRDAWIEDGRDHIRAVMSDIAQARLFAVENPAYAAQYPVQSSYGSARRANYNAVASGMQAANVRSLVKKTLGPDILCPEDAYLPDDKLLELYYAQDSANMELLAALDVKGAELARKLFDIEPGKQLKIIWGPEIETTISRMNDLAVLSPQTLAFLADPQNRELMRARFPEAGLSEEFIDRVIAQQPKAQFSGVAAPTALAL